MNTTRMFLAASALAMAADGTAFAANAGEQQEAIALKGAKVSLIQAITTAEQRTGGQAYDAGADVGGGAVRIAVETNGPGGIKTVTIDARTGKIVSTHAGGEAD